MTVELTGGKDFFCSKGIVTKNNDISTDDEKNASYPSLEKFG